MALLSPSSSSPTGEGWGEVGGLGVLIWNICDPNFKIVVVRIK